MDPRALGVLLVAGGVVAVVAGALLLSGALGWLGRLPGDVRIEREGVRVYVPIASMLLLSLALSALAVLLRRIL